MNFIVNSDIPSCSLIESSIGLLGRAWAGAVLHAMLDGAERFSEIRRAIPEMTDAVLSTRLRDLTEHGLVQRIVTAGPPTQVRYRVTGAGRDTAPILQALTDFAEKHGHLLARHEGR